MPTAIDKVRDIANTMCRSMNLYLVDVEERGNKRKPMFVIYADNEKGITLDECEELSRLVEGEMDVNEVAPAGYRLDVSSPGLDRPLTEDFQFRKNLGRELKVTYNSGDEKREISGKLESFDGTSLLITPAKGEQENINRDAVIMAKVKLQW